MNGVRSGDKRMRMSPKRLAGPGTAENSTHAWCSSGSTAACGITVGEAKPASRSASNTSERSKRRWSSSNTVPGNVVSAGRTAAHTASGSGAASPPSQPRRRRSVTRVGAPSSTSMSMRTPLRSGATRGSEACASKKPRDA